MTADTTVRARLDLETKQKATSVLNSIGLNASDLIRLTFRRVAAEGRIPFALETPNLATRAALAELDASAGARFATIDGLRADLDD
ncbi:MAG: type II toxin-antitoxin system RelB/DinJ family antitoxin [Propionibacteriaceae bacterium]|jgi:DNA-damage-inducible protein J|nr:type II toxin-antitoxin system RelB/DinJ family antitoxin [Propionibacteriaceae bacterium]